MKKFISVFLAAVLLAAVFFALPINAKGENIVPADDSSEFSRADLWSNHFGGELSAVPVLKEGWSNNYCLAFSRKGLPSWVSPCIDLYPVLSEDLLKNSAQGETVRYKIEFDFFIGGDESAASKTQINTLFRCTNEISSTHIANSDNTEFRFSTGDTEIYMQYWYHFTTSASFAYEDVSGTQQWLFCFDSINDNVTGIYIDNFSVCRTEKSISKKVTPDYSGTESVGVEGERTEDISIIKAEEIKRPVSIPDTGEIVTTSKNLLTGSDTDFETEDVNWYSFGRAQIAFAEGYEGNGLKMSTIVASWSSPAINIAPYINQAGVYSVGFFIKFEGENEESQANILLRGGSPTSFMDQSGGNVLGTLSTFRVKNGEWKFVSGEFTVKAEDLANKDEWILCIGSISDGTTTATIDNAQVIFGRMSDLKKGDGSGESELPNNVINSSVELDPSIKNAFYVSLAASVCAAAAVIAFKIKKSGKRSRNV